MNGSTTWSSSDTLPTMQIVAWWEGAAATETTGIGRARIMVVSGNVSASVAHPIIKLLELAEPMNALPRAAQLAELERLASADRRRVSRFERARFGWADAPRRPCYRSTRRR